MKVKLELDNGDILHVPDENGMQLAITPDGTGAVLIATIPPAQAQVASFQFQGGKFVYDVQAEPEVIPPGQ